MAALTVATIAGNAGVVSALWRARRSPQHYPLASLAAADLLVGVSVLPLAAARELFTFRLSFITCACWSTLDVLCCTASILSLCALGWERYRGITDPLSRADRAKKAKLLAVLIWPAAAAVALPQAFVKSDSVSTNEMDKACTVNTNPSYVFFSVTFSFYVPTCIMLVQYGLILRALALRPPIRAHRGQRPIVEMDQMKCPESSQQTDEAGAAERQRRVTITIIRLMCLFLICWTPFFVMLPVDSLCDCVQDSTWQWCTWLGYTNSALNPVVYAAAATRVRRAFQALLKMTRHGE
ncbi:5-hydroxytryptamine receptor 1A-like [Cydia strobilella]|uniref:5-hydroxytryptamine receptor 1A-like n=1 Tax=Cydia strobilella TaxID=1100964 RepID=UPI003005D66F